MNSETLAQFEAELRKVIPDFQVRFKEGSWIQWLIGALIYPFNPRYFTNYTTTFGSKVYFCTKAGYEGDPLSSFITTAHEFVHAWDSRQDKLFRMKYAIPQALGILPILLYGLLAGAQAWILAVPLLGYIMSALLSRKSRLAFIVVLALSLLVTVALGWYLTKWKILVLLGLGVVAPWPSPWRTTLELRGYGMTVAVMQWVFGQLPSDQRTMIVQQFTGPSYFYMCRDGTYVERALEATRQQAQAGALQRISPYKEVYDFLYTHQLVHRNEPRA